MQWCPKHISRIDEFPSGWVIRRSSWEACQFLETTFIFLVAMGSRLSSGRKYEASRAFSSGQTMKVKPRLFSIYLNHTKILPVLLRIYGTVISINVKSERTISNMMSLIHARQLMDLSNWWHALLIHSISLIFYQRRYKKRRS